MVVFPGGDRYIGKIKVECLNVVVVVSVEV